MDKNEPSLSKLKSRIESLEETVSYLKLGVTLLLCVTVSAILAITLLFSTLSHTVDELLPPKSSNPVYTYEREGK